MNNRDLTIVLVVILGVVLLVPVLGASFWGGGMMGPGGMMGRGMMGGYGWGGGFGIVPLLTLILLIAGVILVARGAIGRTPQSDEPLQILRQRLARGEITPQQYEELKKALTQ